MPDKFDIVEIKARELISDYWLPNLEVDVLTRGGVRGRGASPSGTRPLENEAVYLRDGGGEIQWLRRARAKYVYVVYVR